MSHRALAAAAVAAAAVLSSSKVTSFNVARADEEPRNSDLWTWGQSRGGMAGGVSPNPTVPWPLGGRPRDWVHVATNGFHTLALDADGAVWAWGNNDEGQLGDGSSHRSLLPVRVLGLTGVDLIAAGFAHSLAYRRSDDALWAWGSNSAGQLGQPSDALRFSPTPVLVAHASPLVRLAAAGAYNLALDESGAVWSWGENRYGQLGLGDLVDRHAPTKLSGLPAVSALGAGSNHGLAATTTGEVWSWGWNVFGQLGYGYQDRPTDASPTPARAIDVSGAVAVAAGDVHSLALTGTGIVWAWGYNTEGQVGNGQATPADRGVLIPAPLSGLTGVAAIDAGGIHSVALTRAGDVFAWGSNLEGECGTNGRTDERSPARVLRTRHATSIAAGNKHTVAIAAPHGQIRARWYGELESRPPPGIAGAPSGASYTGPIDGLDSVVAAAIGERHGVLVDQDHRLWQWGRDAAGGFRDEPELVRSSADAGGGFVQVAAGGDFSVALRADGSVWTWGEGSFGELGTGRARAPEPERVTSLSEIAAVAAGEHHVLALDVNGRLWTWGDNRHGQLGSTPEDTPVTAPKRVSGITSAIAIAAGGAHSLALTSSIVLFAWGDNRGHQLGVEDNALSAGPTPVDLPFGVTTFSAGRAHSLAVLEGGRVWTFGDARDCQTGWGSRVALPFAEPAAGAPGAVLVAAGGYHSVAIDEGGSVFSWGNDSRGQLAFDGPARRDRCVPMATGRHAQGASVGRTYSLLFEDPAPP